MIIQRYPSSNTYAAIYKTVAEVPAGATVEEMSQAEFDTWLAAQPPLPEPALPVPSPLPAWRIRTILRRRGLLDSVNAMIAQLSESSRIVVEEQMQSSNFERDHPMIVQFGAALGLTSDDLDDIFREADALV